MTFCSSIVLLFNEGYKNVLPVLGQKESSEEGHSDASPTHPPCTTNLMSVFLDASSWPCRS